MPVHLSSWMALRLSRRGFLQSTTTAGLTVACRRVVPAGAGPAPQASDPESSSTPRGFQELQRGLDAHHHWPEQSHECQVLLSRGMSLFSDVPSYAGGIPDAKAQSGQFGDGCDFIAFMPLPRESGASDHGLLCVNHEISSRNTLYPADLSPEDPSLVELELRCIGHSVVEVRRGTGGWEQVPDSPWNRRIDPETPCRISGPAAGTPRMKTSADPSGTHVLGLLAPCAGGHTPWGTVLLAEENIGYFWHGQVPDDHPEADNHKRMRLADPEVWRFHILDDRWDVEQEPHEPNRFGWLVELDPHDPASTPVKRTAMGRFFHEGAGITRTADGRVVLYMGDDTADQFLYRFVTQVPWIEGSPGGDILDEGELSVARFSEAGFEWLPLVHTGALAEEFESQADILIDARRAGEVVGATPMDRPERVEIHPHTGEVYVMLTKNPRRSEPEGPNPKANNLHGQILVLRPGDGDHGASVGTWSLLFEGGPSEEAVLAPHHPDTTIHGQLHCPDNCCFDPEGRLWVTTDGASGAARSAGLEPTSDGLYVVDTEGELRGRSRLFLRAPIGAELTGPCFTPDGRTLFVSVQHPGHGGGLDQPDTRWPDPLDSDMPPRSSVLAIWRKDDQPVG